MYRRDFLKLVGLSIVPGLSVIGLEPSSLSPGSDQPGEAPVDFSLRIAPVKLELAPGRIVDTIGYNGTVPRPLLRVKEGSALQIEVRNDSDVAELVHWHGLTES